MHAHILFDLLAWTLGGAAGLLAAYLGARQSGGYGPAYYAAAAIGAIAGAYGLGSLNLIISGHDIIIGRSVMGALAGAILSIEIYKKLRGISGSTGGAFVGAFSVGIAVGRLGCFFAGLKDYTYGTPTSLPWGVDFGDGISRHPVQLYEASVMGMFALIYFAALIQKRDWAMRRGFYIMVFVYAAQRFAWEFLKPYSGLIGGLNIFHFTGAALIAYALYMMRPRKLAT